MTSPTKAELLSLPPEYLDQWTGERLINASVAFIVMTTVVFTLFIGSRLLHEVSNGWEFWTLYPLSYLCVIGTSVISILMVRLGGVGRHVAYHLLHDPSVIEKYSQLVLATEFVYMAAITLPKIALLLLYLKIFSDHKIRMITWVVVGVVVTHWFSGIVVALALCRPFAFNWNKTIKDGHCADQLAAYRYISAPNLLTDLAMLFLPLSTLYRLQVSNGRKLGLFVTFFAGSLGIITAILRFVEFFTNNLMSDPTYVAVTMQMYCAIEASAYFICSCPPGMRPLVVKAYKKFGSSTSVSLASKSDSHHRRAGGSRRTLPLWSLKGQQFVIGVSDSLQNDDDEERLWVVHMDRLVQVEVSPSFERKDSAAEQDGTTPCDTREMG